MKNENLKTEESKAINYEAVLAPVYSDVRCDFDEDEEEIEPDGYECMSCGNIQDKSTGFGCDRCSGPLKEWYC